MRIHALAHAPVSAAVCGKTEQRSAPCPVSARLFTKLVLEAPVITESALEVIRRYCEDEVSGALGRLFLATRGTRPPVFS